MYFEWATKVFGWWKLLLKRWLFEIRRDLHLLHRLWGIQASDLSLLRSNSLQNWWFLILLRILANTYRWLKFGLRIHVLRVLLWYRVFENLGFVEIRFWLIYWSVRCVCCQTFSLLFFHRTFKFVWSKSVNRWFLLFVFFFKFGSSFFLVDFFIEKPSYNIWLGSTRFLGATLSTESTRNAFFCFVDFLERWIVFIRSFQRWIKVLERRWLMSLFGWWHVFIVGIIEIIFENLAHSSVRRCWCVNMPRSSCFTVLGWFEFLMLWCAKSIHAFFLLKLFEVDGRWFIHKLLWLSVNLTWQGFDIFVVVARIQYIPSWSQFNLAHNTFKLLIILCLSYTSSTLLRLHLLSSCWTALLLKELHHQLLIFKSYPLDNHRSAHVC